MDPIARLQTDMKQALRAGEKEKLDSLRYLYAQLQNLQIEKGKDSQLTEADLQQVVKKILKNTEEAVEQYRAAGRQDLVVAEETKIAVWKEYLPQQLSDEELKTIVKRIQDGNPGLAMGPLIGKVLQETAGRADGGRVSATIRQLQG